MKQYLHLLETIKEKGTYKPPAREGMPGTLSLFGHQFRHDLQDGFPILTTKEVSFKHIVTELLWFLRGDVNIKYLIQNGCNIWNEDAYNYYKKITGDKEFVTFERFINDIKTNSLSNLRHIKFHDYTLGDCGFQYGRVWRNWEGTRVDEYDEGSFLGSKIELVDQISNVINNLKNNPQSRRHLVTALDPANDTNLALYWCHCMFQFNCRPLSAFEREDYVARANNYTEEQRHEMNPNASDEEVHKMMDMVNVPKYYLDCQLYQRSADVFLGVPYNIASYALLTHIIAKIVNMVPGEYIHTFGDVHIYDNHKDQVEEQLTREPKKLPTLHISDEGNDWAFIRNSLDFTMLDNSDFHLANYERHPRIKGKLSTGLK